MIVGAGVRLTAQESTIAPGSSGRLPAVDIGRGVALAAMIIYHFSWDLDYFEFINDNVASDLGWRIFARMIAASFLFLVGVSLVLATRSGFNRRSYWIRMGQVTAGAAAVTAATWFVFPEFFVFFGILHNIAVSSILGIVFLRAPVWIVMGAAVGCILLPAYPTSGLFDHPILLWTGLATERPQSADFVPLFPWFATVLFGIVCARLGLLSPRLIAWLAQPRDGLFGRILRIAGRNSLVVYLVHQPILFGLVALIVTLMPATPIRAASVQQEFLASCQSSCLDNRGEAEMCRSLCQCTADEIADRKMWNAVGASNGKDATQETVATFVRQCADRLPPN